MEMEVEFTTEDDPDKMKDVLAKLEVSVVECKCEFGECKCECGECKCEWRV